MNWNLQVKGQKVGTSPTEMEGNNGCAILPWDKEDR